MATSVSICNLALSKLGGYYINSLSETSKEARLCNTLYDHLRKVVLEGFNWTFARRRQTLALVSGESFSGWDYAYYWPVDCLVIRKILDETYLSTSSFYSAETDSYVSAKDVEYEISIRSNNGEKVILTNQESAELVYTANITDPNLFSNKFVEALAWRLCADMVQPLKGKTTQQKQALDMYAFVLRNAEYTDAQQEHHDVSDSNSFVGAR